MTEETAKTEATSPLLESKPEPVVEKPRPHGKQRQARKDAAAMAKSRKRKVKRKGLRLLREASRNIVTKRMRRNRTDCSVIALRRQPPKLRGEAEQAPGEIIFGMRTGLFGHPITTVLKLPDENLMGCLESGTEEDKTEARKALGELLTQVGLLTVAALFNYNLAWGAEGLPKAIAKWAGIDVEALKAAAAKEAAEEATEGPTVTENVEPIQTEAAPATDALPTNDEHPADELLTDLGGEA